MTTEALHLVTEKHLQDTIVQAAQLSRWRVFHVFDSRHSEAGWPDLVLIKPPRIIFAELKRETGKVTAEQAHVLELLEACGLTVAVWRPSQLDDVLAILQERNV